MSMRENKQQVQSPKKKEKLSTKDIKRLMGMDRQTYKRSHGAIKNK
jgi:hypothetical protein